MTGWEDEKIRQRVGYFRIGEQMLDESPRLVWQAVAQTIVVRCEFIMAQRCLDYTAISPAFDIVTPGDNIPHYVIKITSDDNEPMTAVIGWERVINGN